MVETDPRLVDGDDAILSAFVAGGLGLTLMGLVGQLAIRNHLDALRAFNHVSYVWPRLTGTTKKPHIALHVEADDESWTRLHPHADVIIECLEALSGVKWSLSRALPLTIDVDGGRAEVSRRGVADALRINGADEAAGFADRAVGFRIRPRPDGGRQLMTVWGDSST